MLWRTNEGKVVSCYEKIKVLNQNLEEIKSLSKTFNEIQTTTVYLDALEDAILFGVSEENFILNVKKTLAK